MWIARSKAQAIDQAVLTRPAVLLTGARQTGKSSLLRRQYPDYEYVTLDRIAMATEAEDSPSRFLDRFHGPVILDEVQYAPSLFRELKIRIDESRDSHGLYVLTGSQRFDLMTHVSESLAGRIRVLHLDTLHAGEIRGAACPGDSDYIWKGGYPELWGNPDLHPDDFFESYIDTYLERDLKEIVRVVDLRDFRRFIRTCATRAGQLLNTADVARDIGVSASTIKRWVHALEAGGIVYLLPPYFANIGKRLTKTPKLYFADHGLLCHLLNIRSRRDWDTHPLRGHLWENLVFSELVKTGVGSSGRNLYFYRDQNAVEIDFVIETASVVTLIEAKVSEQPDVSKLNFKSVEPLLAGQVRVQCMVANMLPEDTCVHGKSFAMINPTRVSFADEGVIG